MLIEIDTDDIIDHCKLPHVKIDGAICETDCQRYVTVDGGQVVIDLSIQSPVTEAGEMDPVFQKVLDDANSPVTEVGTPLSDERLSEIKVSASTCCNGAYGAPGCQNVSDLLDEIMRLRRVLHAVRAVTESIAVSREAILELLNPVTEVGTDWLLTGDGAPPPPKSHEIVYTDPVTEVGTERTLLGDDADTVIYDDHQPAPVTEVVNTVGCQAYQASDQMLCGKCGIQWDVNDPEPPECASAISVPDPSEQHVMITTHFHTAVNNSPWENTPRGLLKPDGTEVRVLTVVGSLRGLTGNIMLYKGPIIRPVMNPVGWQPEIVIEANRLVEDGKARWANEQEQV